MTTVFEDLITTEAKLHRDNDRDRPADIIKGFIFCLFMSFAFYGEFYVLPCATYIGALSLMHIGYVKCSIFLAVLAFVSQLCNRYAYRWDL